MTYHVKTFTGIFEKPLERWLQEEASKGYELKTVTGLGTLNAILAVTMKKPARATTRE